MNVKQLATYIGSMPNVKIEVNDAYVVIKNHTVAFYPDAPVFISIPKNAEDLNDISMWYLKLSGIGPKELAHIFNAIMSYINTPIKERYPEKEYYLTAVREIGCSEEPIKQYVTGVRVDTSYVSFRFGSKDFAEKYTEEGLQNISQYFPQEAINVMKEKVKDKNED